MIEQEQLPIDEREMQAKSRQADEAADHSAGPHQYHRSEQVGMSRKEGLSSEQDRADQLQGSNSGESRETRRIRPDSGRDHEPAREQNAKRGQLQRSKIGRASCREREYN